MERGAKTGVSGNFLKLVAMVCMTIDHIGLLLFEEILWLRVIGRLSFPLFAYFIAEGCLHTRNKARHFLLIFWLGVICQLFYFLVASDLYFNILLTFSISVALVYLVQLAQKNEKFLIPLILAVAAAFFVSEGIYMLYPESELHFDYGFGGILFPVLVAGGANRWQKLFLAALAIVPLSLAIGWIEWCAFFSLPLLACYNGTRGKLRLKYFFYFYYPVQMGVIGLIYYFCI